MFYIQKSKATNDLLQGLTSSYASRAAYNFDHPDSFDTEEMVNCLEKLKVGPLPRHTAPIHPLCTFDQSPDPIEMYPMEYLDVPGHASSGCASV